MFNNYKTNKLEEFFDSIITKHRKVNSKRTESDIINSYNNVLIRLVHKSPLKLYNDVSNTPIGINIAEWLVITYGITAVDSHINSKIINKNIRKILQIQKENNGKYKYILDNFFIIDELQKQLLQTNTDKFKEEVSKIYWHTIYHYIQEKPLGR